MIDYQITNKPRINKNREEKYQNQGLSRDALIKWESSACVILIQIITRNEKHYEKNKCYDISFKNIDETTVCNLSIKCFL